MADKSRKNQADDPSDNGPLPAGESPRSDPGETTLIDPAGDLLGASRSSIDLQEATADISDDDLGYRMLSDGEDECLTELEQGYGRYKTFASLGSGGVGDVSSCFDPNLGRYVALKRLHTHLREKASERSRFVREARVMAQIEHPHIVPVHEMGLTRHGTPYFTMKKVRGNSLAEILTELRGGNREMEKRYNLRYLLDIFIHVAQAVAFAHSRGVIHRDLKPSNILIGEFGEVLVVDWGLAKVVGGYSEDPDETAPSLEEQNNIDEIGRESVTLEGVISGTPAYMAPEQAMGKVSELTGQTDIYSLGALLYEILTMQRMIHGDTVREALKNVVQGSIIPPRRRAPERRIPRDLEAICMRAVQRRPEDRYSSVKNLLQDLDNYLNDYPVSARRDSPLSTLWKWAKRHRIFSTSAAAAVAVFLLTAGGLLLSREIRHRTLVSEADGHKETGAILYEDMRRAHMDLVHHMERSHRKARSEDELDLEDRLSQLEDKTENEFQMALVLYARASAQRLSPRIRESLFDILIQRISYKLLKRDYGAAKRDLDFLRGFLGPKFEKATLPERRERLLVYDEMARGMGVLAVETPGGGLTYKLNRIQPSIDGIGKPVEPIPLPDRGYVEMTMPKGSCVVTAEDTRGQVRYSYPFLLAASRKQRLEIPLPPDVPEGMVFIPRGPFVCGGASSRHFRLHSRTLPSFLIKKNEVTFREYIDFWLAPEGGNREDSLRSRVRFDADVMAFFDAWDDDGKLIDAFSLDMPVVGLGQRAAVAYCNWLSGRLARPVRLPRAAEWEKAARGADGRQFPWGDTFQPELALTSENVAARETYPLAAPVGSFPGDRSIYGVLDMAGNVREWTQSTFEDGSDLFQIKGSSFALTRRFAACAYSSDTPVVPSDVGFRYIMPLSND